MFRRQDWGSRSNDHCNKVIKTIIFARSSFLHPPVISTRASVETPSRFQSRRSLVLSVYDSLISSGDFEHRITRPTESCQVHHIRPFLIFSASSSHFYSNQRRDPRLIPIYIGRQIGGRASRDIMVIAANLTTRKSSSPNSNRDLPPQGSVPRIRNV
jgi:hypothetical protein